MWYADEDRETLSDERAPEIWDRFVDLVVGAIGRLRDGRLQALIAHDVPVFVIEEHLYDEPELVLEVNRRANPPEFRDLLERWARGCFE